MKLRDKCRSFCPPPKREKKIKTKKKTNAKPFLQVQQYTMLKDSGEMRRQMRRQGDAEGKVSRDMCHESQWPTEVHGELDSASVQLQAQGVCRLLGGGGHKKTVGPLGHEAQHHVLSLRVHGDRHDDLQVHAAIVTQHRRLWAGVKERTEQWGRGCNSGQRRECSQWRESDGIRWGYQIYIHPSVWDKQPFTLTFRVSNHPNQICISVGG